MQNSIKKIYRETVTPLRIIDEDFYVTVQYSIGYVDRDDGSLSFDHSRRFILNKNDDIGLLYAESVYKDPFEDDPEINEVDIGYFANLKSAVNWVGRYGCPDSSIVQYYYISKRFVYRIWISTHLTGDACNKLFGK